MPYFWGMETKKTAKEIIGENSLNPYELGVLNAFRTKGSEAVGTKAISEALNSVMSGTVLVDGEELTVAQAVVVKVVGDVMANPTTSKLKDLASIVGDVGAQKVEILTSAVDEELAKAAIGEDADGTD